MLENLSKLHNIILIGFHSYPILGIIAMVLFMYLLAVVANIARFKIKSNILFILVMLIVGPSLAVGSHVVTYGYYINEYINLNKRDLVIMKYKTYYEGIEKNKTKGENDE